ncbi:hypothetical protein MYA_4512 [Burkholderia sp. KJ006]|nr:hypothetical protein MYA_4512 [Burkholderia sp. KJ006]
MGRLSVIIVILCAAALIGIATMLLQAGLKSRLRSPTVHISYIRAAYR